MVSPVISQQSETARKEHEINSVLENVLDPELDASVSELGFAQITSIEDTCVTIEVRLPTFFCSANFAWIMCTDAKVAVEKLSWVTHAKIILLDHFAMKKINHGVQNGLSFDEVFGLSKVENFEQMRMAFKEKAFAKRQAELIDELRKLKIDRTRICSLSVPQLRLLKNKGGSQKEFSKLLESYLDIRLELFSKDSLPEFAITRLNGSPLEQNELLDYLREVRRISGSILANGEMCRILMKERYSDGGQISFNKA